MEEDAMYFLGSVSVNDEDSPDLELDVSAIYGTIQTPPDSSIVTGTSGIGASFRGTLQEINDALALTFFKSTSDFNSVESSAMATVTFVARDSQGGGVLHRRFQYTCPLRMTPL